MKKRVKVLKDWEVKVLLERAKSYGFCLHRGSRLEKLTIEELERLVEDF